MPIGRRAKARFSRRRDWGRGIALVLCVVFAVIGCVPLALGLLVRTAFVRSWAARETSQLLARELGVAAHYVVEVQAWPLSIALRDVVVDASDGGSPFLRVERATVRPRPFSLLAGKLDAGDVEIIGPRIRAVVEHGDLTTVRYKLPERKATKDEGPAAAPLASLSVTDANIDLTIDGARARATELDVDVTSEDEGVFEIALRAGKSTLVRTHPFPGRERFEDMVDEDVVCRVDARVRVEPGAVLVRRLAMNGALDFDPDPGTMPSCDLPADDWRAFDVRLGAVRARLPSRDRGLVASGRVHVKLPPAIAHRFVVLPHLTGSVTIDVEGDYDAANKLPRISGTIAADMPGLDGKVFAHELHANVATSSAGLEITKLEATWADGKVDIARAVIDPFAAEGATLTAGPVDVQNIEMHGLLRDLGVHPRAHVAWTIKEGHFDHFGGKLAPVVALEGPISVKTVGFEVFNRAVVDPQRQHMVGVKEGTARGMFVVTPQAVVLQGFSVDTPRSHINTTVSLAYRSFIDIEVNDSRVDLADIDPLVRIPIAGELSIQHVGVHGPFDRPKLEGAISVQGFSFGGFPIGDVEEANVGFEPLVLELTNAKVRHGASKLRSPLTRIAFDKGADVLVDADIDTRDAPHLALKDFYEVFHFDKDPRWKDISAIAKGKAHVHYALGGHEDRCGGGFLDVKAETDVEKVSLFGESYDAGTIDLGFRWDDAAAGANGMTIDVTSASLKKGAGSIIGAATVRHGGVVRGNAIATGVPLARVDMLGPLGKMLDGSMSMIADVSGTLGDLVASADVNVSRVRIGASTLPPSRVRVVIEPAPSQKKKPALTAVCKNERGGAFDQAEWDKDLSAGLFRVSGSLFDGQISFDDFTITEQRHKVAKGKIAMKGLDLGTLSNLVPRALASDAGGASTFSASPPKGTLSGVLDVRALPFDAPKRGDMTLELDELALERAGNRVELAQPKAEIVLASDELDVPPIHVRGRSASGLTATFVASGKVHAVMTRPEVEADVRVEPLDLSKLSAEIPSVERASGSVDADVSVAGPVDALRTTGALHLRHGDLVVKGSPLSIEDASADVEIGGGDVRLKKATARIGGGAVEITGRMPMKGMELGAMSAQIVAHGVKVPIADGVNLTTDANLEATYQPGAATARGEKNLPDVKGTVSLTSFSYTRQIALSLSLNSLGRPQRTNVEAYDPQDDVVKFQITLVSPRPLRFSNNLVDMQLQVVDPGLVLSGTNQRYGARGILRILPDSKLTLRSNEFDVKEGSVRFDDPARIAPKVDLRAQTEYKRYAAQQEQQGPATGNESAGQPGATAATSNGASGIAQATTNSSGNWRVTLNAHGDVDDLKVALTSDPPLSQEDIVLLLTVGMTRAEIDRSAASSLGETVGLEALSALTGADKAVKSVVPIIDEFRFGTGYDSKTAQMEPTVTIGKRVTDNLRASVTTGISDNREVKSNLEWKLNRRMSVQGSYDNVNDVSSSALGNVGVDLRWRLEFE